MSASATSKTTGSRPAATTCTSNGATDAGQIRPLSSLLQLGDDREDARHADAVGPHRHRDELAVLVEHLEPERLGVLAAELEDVADLHAAGEFDRAGAVGRRVAGAHLGDLDGAVAGEVAAGDQAEDVVALRRSRR